MEKYLNIALVYLLSQANKITAWIGFIGLCLWFLGLTNLLYWLFVALIVLPQETFSEKFKQWTEQATKWHNKKE